MSTSLQQSSSISTATGEADRAFRLEIQLEKTGLARAASAAFQEADMLYQYSVDQSSTNKASSSDSESRSASPTNIFQHVTSLTSNEDLRMHLLSVPLPRRLWRFLRIQANHENTLPFPADSITGTCC